MKTKLGTKTESSTDDINIDALSTEAKKLIGARIRLAREQIGMSQETLALILSKSQDAISNYERGARGLQSAELPVFGEVLGVPISFFFGDIKPAEELADIYDSLSDTGKQRLIEYAHLVKRQLEEK